MKAVVSQRGPQLAAPDLSLGSLVLERARRWPSRSVFAQRRGDEPYRMVTWSTLLQDMEKVAALFSRHGIRQGEPVAVFSSNSYSMLVWELAVVAYGAVSVPVFAGYKKDGLNFILGHAQPKAIFVQGKKRRAVYDACDQTTSVDLLVTSEGGGGLDLHTVLSGEGTFDLAARAGRVGADEVAFIQYTSGTTGDPKGVMLTHRNIVSQRLALSSLWPLDDESRFLSYLPWHHSFGGLFERFSALYHGATIYLEDSFGKELKRLLDNWRQVKPTQFFSVPKVFQQLVTEAKLDTAVHADIFHPDLKFVFTAAAPLPRECREYFEKHRVPVAEGWGLTETSPCVTFTPPNEERNYATVGHPIPGCEICTDEHDEILVRGPNVMKGYFQDQDLTAEKLDSYGWFHTGDLGEITADGLRIICRSDGLFKLSNGEKVSSMEVENVLTQTTHWIQSAVAVGSGQDYVSALVFPNFRNLRSWAEGEGIQAGDETDLARHPRVQDLVAEEIEKNLPNLKTKYMAVKAIVLLPRELSVEHGELTPTLKIRRKQVVEHFKDWQQAIYDPQKHPKKQAYVVRIKEHRHAVS